MHLIGSEPGRGTDGIVVSQFHVRQMNVPIMLLLVDDYSYNMSQGRIHALDAAVPVRMVQTCSNFPHATLLVDRVRLFGADLEAIVREATNGAAPQRDVLVDQDVRGGFDRVFGSKNGVHAGELGEPNG